MPPNPGSAKQDDEIVRVLERFRDHPTGTADTSDKDLVPLHSRLMKTNVAKDGSLHWFCSRADSITRELASFLLRLHAYNNEKVEQWRTKLLCVWKCPECIHIMDEVKKTSRTTYFGAFPDYVLERFWANFEDFEVKYIVESLVKAGITAEAGSSFADIPSYLMYHLLSKIGIFSDNLVLKLLSSQQSFERSIDWPMNPIPVGYLLLATHKNQNIRSWAFGHINKAETTTQENISTCHELSLRLILHRIDGLAIPSSPMLQKLSSEFPFTESQATLWNSLRVLSHNMSNQVIKSQRLHSVVISHLHDNDIHFPEVLRCMLELLRKLSKDIWEGESAEYPQIVFDSIKDNPSYLDLILSSESQKESPWSLSIFSVFLLSVWDMQIFEKILARFMAFFCNDLQHERFQDKRSMIMGVAAHVVNAAITKANNIKSALHRQAITNIVDIHFDLIMNMALADDYAKPDWKMARQKTILLLRTILNEDVDKLKKAYLRIMSNGLVFTQEDATVILPNLRLQNWQKVYSSLSVKHVDGIIMLFEILAKTAMLDRLNKRTISRPVWNHHESLKSKPPQSLLDLLEKSIDQVNNSLDTMRSGLSDCVLKFAAHIGASTLLDAIRQSELGKYLVFMMLSPVESLNTVARTYISQTFDVDVRSDCFREIMKETPTSSFQGLREYIEQFSAYASNALEACSVSKALVRCLTDVIEVLGNSPGGLLHDTSFMKKSSTDDFALKVAIPKLWKAMTQAISVIFKRTPKWSIYFDNKTMTEWMRDALIFARDLLDRRRSFETVLSEETRIQGGMFSPRKISVEGKGMVGDLQSILYELTAWLRLTDMELLYQSFALLKALLQCFHETDMKPSPDSLTKLKKFVSTILRSDDTKRVSYLSRSDLSELELVLANFEENGESNDDLVLPKSKRAKKETAIEISSSSESEITQIKSSRVTKHPKEPIFELSRGAAKSSKQTKFSTGKSVHEYQKKMGNSKYKRIGPRFEGAYNASTKSAPTTTSASESSSSSSSESEDSDGNRGLASLANLQRKREEAQKLREKKKEVLKKESKRTTERRKAILIEDPNLSARNNALERLKMFEEARRTAMRLRPDITPLHRMILSWNYDYEGSFPPIKDSRLNLRNVPDTFGSHKEYLDIFQPLLMLECWAQLVKSKEETSPETYVCKISSRATVDQWTELEAVVMDIVRPDWRLTPEVDIVLLRHKTEKTSIMAKVLGFNKNPSQIEIGLRYHTEALDKDPGLFINTEWRLTSVFSLTTLHREFAALTALPYYDMADMILRPRLSDPFVAASSDIQQAMTAYQVNEPQAKAILSAMKTKGFTLIQGPPGTGKTWTICGLVGAFLSSRRAKPTPIGAPGRAEITTQQKMPVQKILICAPSNAAIDEVTKRLVQGVRGSDGQRLTPKVVRVGADASINVSVKEASLDWLVSSKLEEQGVENKEDGSAELNALRIQLNEVKAERQKKFDEIKAVANNGLRVLALENEIKSLNAKRLALSQKLNNMRDEQRQQSRGLDAVRRKMRFEILSDADIICSTLSGSGHEQLEPLDFGMIIIDEAAQSIELSSLIPLKYRCTQCIMVGDPQQLPPTVLSPEASKWGYDQSLFVRMMKQRPQAVHLLSIQYRMHPMISQLPSKVFYDGRLHDGPEMDKKTEQPWHADPRFGVYKFFSVTQGREEASRVGHSLINREEINAVLALYGRIRSQFPSVIFDYRIGIVSMYRAQVQEFRAAFRSKYGRDIVGRIDFNTVDGFQGQEKDIIILSCVRAGTSLSSIGFLADIRRMNVAITRSRSSLYIVGHGPTLERSNETWKSIIEDARSRQCFVELSSPYFVGGFKAPQATPPTESSEPKPKKQKQNTNNVTVDVPPPDLFSPKNVKKLPKGVTSRKLPLELTPLSNGIKSDSQVASEAKVGVKRPFDGPQRGRPPPTEREIPSGIGSEAGMSSIIKTGNLVPVANDNSQDIAPDRAARELEAFKRRKKNASNLFIKR